MNENTEKVLIAEWSSPRGRYWANLYEYVDGSGYIYRMDNGGGVLYGDRQEAVDHVAKVCDLPRVRRL